MKTFQRSRFVFHFCLILIISITSCSTTTVSTNDDFELVELPDGSVVYLNHNSSLDFDSDFEPREVHADGELYFSVAKGESPFTVRTKSGEITVLGTEFSVKATAEDVEVEVEEGIVELKTNDYKVKVKRGQHGVYREGDEAIQTIKAEFKYRVWMKELKIAFKTMGREFKHGSKGVGKESKKTGKKIKKELKSLKQGK
jgi:ferric-dicitrate binding protein FerR (iron transport regulator)